MKLLIDTNIFLDFYRDKRNALSILGRLNTPRVLRNLIVTEQVCDEFERNREGVLLDLAKNFLNESSIQSFPSSFLQETTEFKDLIQSKAEYEGRRNAVKEKIEGMIREPSSDPVLSEFKLLVTALSKYDCLLQRSDETIKAAETRKRIGNPPASSTYSIGDEINWEIVLSSVKEDLFIVGRDSTYWKNLSFLKREFHSRTGHFIIGISEYLTEGLSQIGQPASKEMRTAERKLIEDLSLIPNHFYWPSQD